MKSIGLILVITGSLLAPAAQPSPDAAAEVRAARARSNQGLAARNIEAFTETLADDIVMIRGSSWLM